MSEDSEFLQFCGGVNHNSLNNVLHITDDENIINGANDANNYFHVIQNSSYYHREKLHEWMLSKRNQFCMLSTNIESISSKFSELEIFIRELKKHGVQFSAIYLQEAWLSEKDDVSQFQLENYSFIFQGKSCSNKGGLIVYLHEMFNYDNVLCVNNSDVWEGQFINVRGGGLTKNIILGNLYRPPRDIRENYETFYSELLPIVQRFEKSNSDVVLTGDTNINLLKLNEREIFSDFYDMLTSCSFFPKITLPTRFTKNNATLLDNFFCKLSPTTMEASAGILMEKFSDHQPYFMSLNTFTKAKPPIKYVKYRKQNEENMEQLKYEISGAEITKIIDKDKHASPEKNYNVMESVILQAVNNHIPIKTVKFSKHKHKKSDWITNGIVRSIKFRDKMYVRLKKTDPSTDLYNTLKTNLCTYNCILKKSIRNAKKIYYEKCFEKYKGDARKTWSVIRDILSKQKNKKSFPEYFTVDGINISNSIDIANGFNKYFTQIGPCLAQSIDKPTNKTFKDYLRDKCHTRLKFVEVNNECVMNIINNMKPKSSCGHDGLSIRFIKEIKDIIIDPLTIIINQMLKTGIFPDSLKIAKVIPLYKKGDEHIFTNYRPISLLPAFSKIFEKVIYIQLYDYVKLHKLLYRSQYGFRSEHSTELAALELVDRLIQDMDDGKVPFSVFIDLSKAFDTLDHYILIEKLKYYGIEGVQLQLFKSYLENRKQFVDINGTNSELLPINTGVPQGSVLGPLLFLIYVNDISVASNLLKALNYADDTTLSSTLCAFEVNDVPGNSALINSELNNISIWLRLNMLSLNVDKTKCMVFHTAQKNIVYPNLEIDGTAIEQVSTFNLLGIIFDENLTWKHHIDYICNKISRTNGILNRIKHYIPLHVKLSLYNSLVLSHLNYGILAWGLVNGRIIKLQKRSIRTVTASKYNAHTEPIFKELKLLKFEDMYKVCELKFYYKYVHNNLPEYFQMLPFQANKDVHTHNTRYNTNIHIRRANHMFAKKCIRYHLPITVNNLDECIKEKVYTHSLQGFYIYVKNKLVNSYDYSCSIHNCYVCQHT